MGWIKSPKAKKILIRALKDSDHNIRYVAANALFYHGLQVRKWIELLERDPDESVQIAAIRALGFIEDPQAEDALLKALGEAKWDTFEGIIYAFVYQGSKKAVPLLIDKLKIEKWNAHDSTVIWALGLLGDQRAVPILLDYCQQPPEYYLRNYAIRALGRIKAKDAGPVLMKFLEDENEEIRKDTAAALGEIGHKEAVEKLSLLLGDEKWAVREAAQRALQAIGTPSALRIAKQFLIQEMKKAKE